MKLKNIYLLFVLFLPVSVMGRFFQLSSTINPSTGFFSADAADINFYMCAAFVVFAFFLFCCTLFYKGYSSAPIQPKPVLAVFSLILALTLLIDLGAMVTSIGGGVTAFQILHCALLMLSAAVFCLFAVWSFSGVKVNVGGLMLVPIVLWIVRLIADFMSFTGMANISENVIKLIMICTSMVFLLYHGKLVGGMGSVRNRRMAVAFGMPAAVLCLISTLPRYILYFVDATKLHEGLLGDPADLALGVYIAVFIWQCLKEEQVEAVEATAEIEEIEE